MDTSDRNRVLAKAVEVLGIAEMASRLRVSETLVRAYAFGAQPIPDPVWLLTVNYLVERVSAPPFSQPANLL